MGSEVEAALKSLEAAIRNEIAKEIMDAMRQPERVYSSSSGAECTSLSNGVKNYSGSGE